MEEISISAQVHVAEAQALEGWLRDRILIQGQAIADLQAEIATKDEILKSVQEETAERMRALVASQEEELRSVKAEAVERLRDLQGQLDALQSAGGAE